MCRKCHLMGHFLHYLGFAWKLPWFDLRNHVSTSVEWPVKKSQKDKTFNPAVLEKSSGRQNTITSVYSVIILRYLIPFANCGQFQNIRHTVKQLATNPACFSIECNHCSTVVLTVRMKLLSIVSKNARWTSCRNRDASKAAGNSNFRIAGNFVIATRAFPKTNANSVLFVALVTSLLRKKATSLKTSWELSPNLCTSSLSTASRK